MNDARQIPDRDLAPQPLFATTRWSVVLASANQNSPDATAALEELCKTYWYPLYAFVRRRGYSPEEAEDLTQEFFLQLLRRQDLRHADPQRGRFRTFLLCAFEHFLINEWKRAQRIKRGGGVPCLPLDFKHGEERYSCEPVDNVSPEHAYDRHWAQVLLERVLASLEAEYSTAGQTAVFKQLAALLWGKDSQSSYCSAARQLSMTEGAVRTAMHRLRNRFRHALRETIAQTVTDSSEVEQELRYLIEILARIAS